MNSIELAEKMDSLQSITDFNDFSKIFLLQKMRKYVKNFHVMILTCPYELPRIQLTY